MDPLFPLLPEDLSAVSDEDLAALEAEHLEAQRLIRANDADFLGDLNAAQIIEQATAGKAQLLAVRAEKAVRLEAVENYDVTVADLTSESAETDAPDDDDGDDAVALEAEAVEEVIVASADEPAVEPVVLRRPPAPDSTRKGVQVEEVVEPHAILLTASGIADTAPGTVLDPDSLSRLILKQARRLGKPKHTAGGGEDRYLLASAQYPFPDDRKLTSDLESNARKIKALRNTEGHSLVASGGLCAPLTPIYSIPQFAVTSRPVRDALPSFNADRGGVNVPVPTTLASAAEAITIIIRGRGRSRWHLRDEGVFAADVPGVRRDGSHDHRSLPRVRQPQRKGVAGVGDVRERVDDGAARKDGRVVSAGPDQGAVDQRHDRRHVLHDARPDLRHHPRSVRCSLPAPHGRLGQAAGADPVVGAGHDGR